MGTLLGWLTAEFGFQDILVMSENRLAVLDGDTLSSKLRILDVESNRVTKLRRFEGKIGQIVANDERVTWVEKNRIMQFQLSR